MKRNPNLQKWIPSALVGLALAGSTSLGLAADITYSFDSDVQGWYAADGNGTVTWGSTNGRGGGGCLVCTLPSDGTTNGPGEIDPRVDVAYDTSGYFSVEYDVMVDSASGTDATGIYGNLQMVDWDASWNWHAEWYGSLGGSGGPFSGTWKHIKQAFTATYGARVRLAFQIKAATAPYTTNVVIYIDNVIIRDGTPPNKAIAYSFTQPDECVPANSWGGVSRAWSQDLTAGSNGPCLKQVVDYGPTNSGWIDSPGEFHDFDQPPFDPSKFTYLDFDLMIDAPTGMSTYGQYQVHYWYSWTGIGTVGLSEANIGKWTHYSFALPASTSEHGLVLHPGGNNLSNTITYYLDNVTLWKPAGPPTINRLTKNSGTGGGVMITMEGTGAANQWFREAIVTPAASGTYLWPVQSAYPVAYSFTITNFPATPAHHGFQAHMYIVNADTGGGDGGWNATYGGVDWNVPDIFMFAVENNAAGGVIAHIDWKTNLPNNNPPADAIYHPLTTNGPTALGTWTVSFTSPTDGTVTGPGISATPFTIPGEAATNNFSPTSGYIQFGMFKNDGANDGHNNYVNGTFSHVQLSVGNYPNLDDSFTDPTLPGWRKTTSSNGGTAVQWSPAGIDTWLTWTTPDDGYEAYVCGTVNGTYTDGGVGATTGYSYTAGATRTGGIPAANMPAGSGNAAFFQLRKY